MRSFTLKFVVAAVLSTAVSSAIAAETTANVKTMSTIRVEGDAEGEGTVLEGYRSSRAGQIGPLGEVTLQDTPFSVAVIPSELIENLQATKPDDLFKIQPGAQLRNPQSRFFSSVNIRGFDLASTKHIDNVPSTSQDTDQRRQDLRRI